MHVLLTGANRGIGLELARQLLSRGDKVEAAVRRPEAAGQLRALAPAARLRIHECDVGDAASVAALARVLGSIPLDALVNNAGVWGGEHQGVRDFDFEEAVRTYEVNALGALRMTLAVLPHLARGQGKKILHVTSGMGSIEDNRMGGVYAYRMSKAALNMMARSLAVDLKPQGIASAVVNPGWVRTDMGGPSAPTPVAESVKGIIDVLDKLDMSTSGSFLHWRGGVFPW